MSFAMLPNTLTIFRIILTVPIVIAVLKEQYFLVLLLFTLAGITDALDGWIAKHYSLQSRLGSILDPTADKILLACTFVSLYWVDLLPLWVLLIIIARDLMIVAAAVGYFLGEMNSEDLLEPSLISKINTVLQILLVIYLILAQFYIELIVWLEMAFVIVATSTTLSGADYTWLWVRRFIFQEKKN